jgi:plastocyanin
MFDNHNNMSRRQTIAIFSALLTALALSTTLGGFAVTSVSAQGGSNVSIVSGASTMADKAYSPNPINVKVGDTVTWTNDDSQPHTVTSGKDSSDPDKGKVFDSSPNFNPMLSPKQTFQHKFTTAGEVPYFCQIHPTMVGKVVVS